MHQARRKTSALDAPCRIANRASKRCNHSNQQSICGRPDEFGALSVSVGLSSSYSGHRTAGNCSCVLGVAYRILPTAAASLSLYASVLDKFYSSLEAATHPVHQRTTPSTKAGSAPHRQSPLAVVNSTAPVWLFPTISDAPTLIWALPLVCLIDLPALYFKRNIYLIFRIVNLRFAVPASSKWTSIASCFKNVGKDPEFANLFSLRTGVHFEQESAITLNKNRFSL